MAAIDEGPWLRMARAVAWAMSQGGQEVRSGEVVSVDLTSQPPTAWVNLDGDDQPTLAGTGAATVAQGDRVEVLVGSGSARLLAAGAGAAAASLVGAAPPPVLAGIAQHLLDADHLTPETIGIAINEAVAAGLASGVVGGSIVDEDRLDQLRGEVAIAINEAVAAGIASAGASSEFTWRDAFVAGVI